MRNTSEGISWNCTYATQKCNPGLQKAPIVSYFPRKDTFPWFLLLWLLMQFQPHFIVQRQYCIFYFSGIKFGKMSKTVFISIIPGLGVFFFFQRKKVMVATSTLEQCQSQLAFRTKRAWSSCDWCWSIRRKRLTSSCNSCWETGQTPTL